MERKEALEKMIRTGLINETTGGRLRRSAPKYKTTDDVLNIALRKAHAHNLVMARESLEKIETPLRDFSSITLAMSPEKLPRAKEMIRKFQDDLADLVETGDRTEVYKMCIQLFPLTILKESKP